MTLRVHIKITRMECHIRFRGDVIKIYVDDDNYVLTSFICFHGIATVNCQHKPLS